MIWEILEIAAILVLINFVVSNLSSGGAIYEILKSPANDEEQVKNTLEKAMNGKLLKLEFSSQDSGNNLFK